MYVLVFVFDNTSLISIQKIFYIQMNAHILIASIFINKWKNMHLIQLV